MKIAMVVPSLANKGPVIVAKDLCEEFVKMGHICKVYYFDDILELKMPCEVEKISFGRSIDFNEWDIIHTHGLRPDCYVRLHRPIINKINTKFISTQHNPISIKEINQSYNIVISIIASILWHIALTAVDKVVYLNKITQATTILLKRKESVVIYNGRNINTANNQLNCESLMKLRKHYKIIGTISNVIKRKGLEQMVYALKNLPNCVFCIVGEGPEKKRLYDLSIKLGVNDRCYWAGYNPNAHQYHKYFDAFVMCTRSEGFPLALIEASAYGTPTVLSDIPILRSIVPKPIVEFYKLDNIDDLCVKINNVLQDNNYKNAINEYYHSQLTSTIMAKNYIIQYKM